MADNVIKFPATETEGSDLMRRLSREANRQTTTVTDPDHYERGLPHDALHGDPYGEARPIRVRIEQPTPSTAQSIMAILVYFAQGVLGVLMIAFLIKQIFGG